MEGLQLIQFDIGSTHMIRIVRIVGKQQIRQVIHHQEPEVGNGRVVFLIGEPDGVGGHIRAKAGEEVPDRVFSKDFRQNAGVRSRRSEIDHIKSAIQSIQEIGPRQIPTHRPNIADNITAEFLREKDGENHRSVWVQVTIGHKLLN